MKLTRSREMELLVQGSRQYMAMFDDNPYKTGTWEAKLWFRGWREAKSRWEKVWSRSFNRKPRVGVKRGG